MFDAPWRVACGQVARFPHRGYQYSAPRPDPGIFAVPLPKFVHRDLRQFRDPLNVSESDAGDSAKLVLDGSHTLLKPDCGDWVSVAIHGSYADRNDRLPLGFGQLLIIERDNNNSHTPLRRTRQNFRSQCPRASMPFPY